MPKSFSFCVWKWQRLPKPKFLLRYCEQLQRLPKPLSHTSHTPKWKNHRVNAEGINYFSSSLYWEEDKPTLTTHMYDSHVQRNSVLNFSFVQDYGRSIWLIWVFSGFKIHTLAHFHSSISGSWLVKSSLLLHTTQLCTWDFRVLHNKA